MFNKLDHLEEKYTDLSNELGDPSVVSNLEKYQQIARAHSELQDIVEKYREYKTLIEEISDAEALVKDESDEEMRAFAREELGQLEERKEQCEKDLHLLLVPKDPNDERDVILEIRAGTGGDEATLFAAEIFRMYCRYAEAKKWKTDILSSNPSSVGGLKEVIASISGKRVYSRMRFESGVQRVQRVPETETQGRVHTSAITVAVLPEADEVEIKVDPSELRIDTYCSSGPGGQSVNTTYSAVRITHLPTNEVVTCQDEKSQIKNKAKAMKVLRSRLYERAQQEQQQEIAANRRSMVGSGDRSEKIRTYNYPQNRVTDHRINLTLHRLEAVMQGGLDSIIDALTTHYQALALQEQTH